MLLNDATIVLLIKDQDRYRRLVADAYLVNDSVTVNQRLVEQGAAWVYTRYTDNPELIAAQQAAQKLRVGLWSLAEADRVAPWEWRKSNNK